ncbi:hypothetical protein RND81_14G193200 [Saponaria officinalis]|uniref:Uncharacterized protein n=1 Tax=Saponaria officinalis TaxID=3572 RepID=A0AAW1GP07_SAPOF
MRIILLLFVLHLVVTHNCLLLVVARSLLHFNAKNERIIPHSNEDQFHHDHLKFMSKFKNFASWQNNCVGNDVVLDDKRVVPTGPNPLHNK